MRNVLQRLDQLIEAGTELRDRLADGTRPEAEVLKRATDTARWVESSEHVLSFIGLGAHRERFDSTYKGNSRQPYKYAQLVGVLESAKDEIVAGFLDRLVYLAHADLFGSVIEQAQELRDAAHLTPAAVLGRIVIERWLRDEAERSQIADHATAKASVLNERLRAAGVFATPRWRLIKGTSMSVTPPRTERRRILALMMFRKCLHSQRRIVSSGCIPSAAPVGA